MIKDWMRQKKRYRNYRSRVNQVPKSYLTTIVALERYLYVFGPNSADSVLTMLEDLVDLFEQSSASSTPVREIVGNDPVLFAQTFLDNYDQSQLLVNERERLISAVKLAEEREH